MDDGNHPQAVNDNRGQRDSLPEEGFRSSESGGLRDVFLVGV